MRRLLDGGIYVSEAVGNNMIQKCATGGAYISTNLVDRLSNRELQILHLIGKGMSSREMARSLNLSVKTVESHRLRIKRKLNLESGRGLIQYAVKWFAGCERTALYPAEISIALRKHSSVVSKRIRLMSETDRRRGLGVFYVTDRVNPVGSQIIRSLR